MSRGLWFAAGAGAGVYAMSRVRRAVESLSADGLRDRWHGLTHATRLVTEEVTSARLEREDELRQRFGLTTTTTKQLASAPTSASDSVLAAPALIAPPDPDPKDIA